jgi:Uncharacterized paraquat-inducible protein A
MNLPLILKYKKTTIAISILVILDILLFSFGIFTPFLTLKKFFIFNEQITLVGSVKILFKYHQYFLGALIMLFSIIFPIVKLSSLAFIWFFIKDKENVRKWIKRVEVVGNWSMLDVFIIAITVVSIKLSGLGNMKVHYGLYLFASSVILTKFTLVLIQKSLKEENKI